MNIFWHICELNYWRDVVEDQFNSLLESGLLSACEKVHVTFLGKSEEEINFLANHPKVNIRNFSKNLNEYERICLNDLRKWSMSNDSTVFYFHSKGVSKPEFKDNIWEWRKMMEYFLVDGYKNCLEQISNYDAIGVSLCNVGTDASILGESHKWHFSGNFWWSKTSHIRRLPPIPELDMSIGGNYWLCERWILQPWPDVKVLEIHRPELCHYYNVKPEEYRVKKSI